MWPTWVKISADLACASGVIFPLLTSLAMFATNVDNFSISSGVIERDATWLFLSISIAVFPFVAIAVLKVINRA